MAANNKKTSNKDTKRTVIKLEDIIERVNTPYVPLVQSKPKKINCFKRLWYWITRKSK